MFDYYYVVCVDYVQYWYVVDWVGWVGVCYWIDYVVGIDYQYYVGIGEFGVDVVYVGDQVVGYVGFGQQYVYVFGYVFGYWVDCEFYFYVMLVQLLCQFLDFVLGLCYCYVVVGYDYYVFGKGYYCCDV